MCVRKTPDDSAHTAESAVRSLSPESETTVAMTTSVRSISGIGISKGRDRDGKDRAEPCACLQGVPRASPGVPPLGGDPRGTP